MKRTTATVHTTRTSTATSSKTTAAKRGPRVLAGQTVVQAAAARWVVMPMEERNTYAALIAPAFSSPAQA